MADLFVYILECSDNTYYVGYAADPLFRLEYHQSGRGSAYTSKRLPVRLVYQEGHQTEDVARAREKQIKRWSHAKKAALVSGDIEALNRLSRSNQSRKSGTARKSER